VASDQLSNLLRREADIAVRMVRPAQESLIARKLADIPIVACAHRSYLQRAGTPAARHMVMNKMLWIPQSPFCREKHATEKLGMTVYSSSA
jgi:DNA-binding transcriptional LysR family regulator